MFTRSAFRTCRGAGPLKSIRGYASESPSSGGLSQAVYGVIGVGALGGGYYYYANVQGKAPPVPVPTPQTEKTAALASTGKAFTGGDQGFISLKLANVETVSSNTKKFRFELPEPTQTTGLPIASAVITKYKGPEMEKAVIRPYTPTSDENEQGHIDFVIKAYPNGPMSQHLHSMTPGQRLDIKGPIPKYPMEENKHTHVAMIAGGTGITPMYQVICYIFNNPNDKTKISLIYGNLGEDDILLKKELAELENTYPRRFRAFYTLDNPPESWSQGKGFITKDLLKTVLPEPKEDGIKIFVCGPPGLYKAISGGKDSPQDQGELSGALAELGYGKDQVYKF